MRSSSSLRSSAASHPSSHTVNGKYYSIITFVFPSLRSGTRDVRTSSSLHSSAASHPSSHTASGRYCCNLRMVRCNGGIHVSIPQAVGTVATKYVKRKSIVKTLYCFNTASGRYCCNNSSGSRLKR